MTVTRTFTNFNQQLYNISWPTMAITNLWS